MSSKHFSCQTMIACYAITKGTPKGENIALLWIFTDGGGGKPKSKAYEECCYKPFFSLSLNNFRESGGGAKSKPFGDFYKL